MSGVRAYKAGSAARNVDALVHQDAGARASHRGDAAGNQTQCGAAIEIPFPDLHEVHACPGGDSGAAGHVSGAVRTEPPPVGDHAQHRRHVSSQVTGLRARTSDRSR